MVVLAYFVMLTISKVNSVEGREVNLSVGDSLAEGWMRGDSRSSRRNAYSSANCAHQESVLTTPESRQVLYSKITQRLRK